MARVVFAVRLVDARRHLIAVDWATTFVLRQLLHTGPVPTVPYMDDAARLNDESTVRLRPVCPDSSAHQRRQGVMVEEDRHIEICVNCPARG
jgi:hypothetical protein